MSARPHTRRPLSAARKAERVPGNAGRDFGTDSPPDRLHANGSGVIVVALLDDYDPDPSNVDRIVSFTVQTGQTIDALVSRIHSSTAIDVIALWT